MKYVNNLPRLSTMLCPFLMFLAVFFTITACSSESSRVKSEPFQPDDIKAVVLIESPKVGTLLQLRGIAGKGVLIARKTPSKQQDDLCVSVPIRFAAGDFGGSSINIDSADSIRLAIYSDEVANRLISGDEVVSEDYQVTDGREVRLGDIKIESGLTLSYGFVLNPGEWSWSSLFGLDQEEVNCEVVFS
ncbi:hypothetical protein [Marinomonas transparens]|uniref:Uncharacterized protein n=1 Tax=Marinomonas transparens TaxID=2795388 RepID=A0A934JT18_9GAMM|nr:hypothetical protein [Marinomonas transparens]MBJ7539388.1 hypothetical protein [Marinomonas transparens]